MKGQLSLPGIFGARAPGHIVTAAFLPSAGGGLDTTRVPGGKARKEPAENDGSSALEKRRFCPDTNDFYTFVPSRHTMELCKMGAVTLQYTIVFYHNTI